MNLYQPTILALSTVAPPTLVALLATIIGVPIGVITFALRGLREQITAARTDFDRRIEHGEQAFRRLETRITAAEHEFATKEDWLRECMLARRGIERLTESVARLESGGDGATHSIRNNARASSQRNEHHRHLGGTD